MQDNEDLNLARRARPGGRAKQILERIYASTLDILREKGLSGVSFNEVASAAEVNRSTLYRRWEDRNELVMEAILTSVIRQVTPAATSSLEHDLTAVLEQIGAYLNSPLGHAVLIAALELNSKDTPTSRRHIEAWRRRLRDFDPIFDAAEARGEIPPGFDREAALAMVAGAIYVRVMIHNCAVDRQWVERIMSHWRKMAPPPRSHD